MIPDARTGRGAASGKGGATSVAGAVDRVAAVVSIVSTALATIAVLWLMVTTVAHVALRATGRSGLAGIVEVNALVMVAVVFLGLAGAQRSDAHVTVRLFVTRMPRRAQSALSVVGQALSAVLVTWLVWASADELADSYASGERLTGVAPVAIWPARAVLVFGLAGLLIELANGVLKRLVDGEAERPVEPIPAIPEG